MNDDGPKFKIIFLGDQAVGKSSILNRFAQDKFENDYSATIGLDFHSKQVLINNENVRLLLYDTAGQEKFKSLLPMYIRDANIIIVVYDITSKNIINGFLDKDSFIHTSHWINEVKDLRRADAIFALVGNKSDLNDRRAVSTEEAEAVANEKNFIFQEVSAKTGSGINTLFQQEIYGRIARVLNLGDEPVQTERPTQPVKLDGQNANNQTNKKKKCC